MARSEVTSPGGSERRQRMFDDAAAFLHHAEPRSRVVLERLIEDGVVRTDRGQTWHAVASVLVVGPDRRILLARNKQGWGTVGGHIDPGDPSIRAAAVREALEEIGLHLDEEALEPLAFLTDESEVRPGHAHLDFCYLHRAAELVEVTPASDVSAARWFPLDDLPDVNAHIAALVASVPS